LAGGSLLPSLDGGSGGGGQSPRPLIVSQQLDPDSLLTLPASDAPIETVVVVMMENRSFDHYLGWLADDQAYLDAGRSRYGGDFQAEGRQKMTFKRPDGKPVETQALVGSGKFLDPYSGCGYRDPGHGWTAGRAQLRKGFLAKGSGNDEFALGYFGPDEILFQGALARRFTLLDHYFSSVLGSTWLNREYLNAATAMGKKRHVRPINQGEAKQETIWQRLAAAGVPARSYYYDLPTLVYFGKERMKPFIASGDRYFEEAARGQLPNVVFIDPGFRIENRTNDHPWGDAGLGQRFLQEIFRAFVQSPHWDRGVFIVSYDEWGGFFDHVRPPVLADDRYSRNLDDNFGQAGFRVPTLVASPYARPGYADHTVYDHTSILRFLEWRFLGAPPTGSKQQAGRWWLTKRDRNAANLGASLRASNPDPELRFAFDDSEPDLSTEMIVPCDKFVDVNKVEAEWGVDLDPEFLDLIELDYAAATALPWLQQ
jgi:phospholipase C